MGEIHKLKLLDSEEYDPVLGAIERAMFLIEESGYDEEYYYALVFEHLELSRYYYERFLDDFCDSDL